MKLYEKINYKSSANFLVSSFIREYDISKANINILFKYNCIDQNMYNYLCNADRMERQRTIGMMQKDPKVTQVLQKGIEEAKKMLFETNNIKDNEVLMIKNDAVFLINKIPNITKFGNIEFMCKNIYTSFYRIKNLELFYFYDQVLGNEILDVKGMSPDAFRLHENYFGEFLKVVFNSAQVYGIKDTLDIVISFYNKYLALEVDMEYYRQFDSNSQYLLKPISQFSVYTADNLSKNDKDSIDIGYNLDIIRTLYQIYSSIQLNAF